ncbi:T9SS type A sorting domain-containing protein [Subsaxibacter sp. CAU 1640]|uniref:T9SS type A sorting domain-containing protein n=1 Tax=Subsaxibacter sp. CAU 1640 TaxID=2933271 RepID=UPI002003F8A8|nr:T9SS type A sorting domain-containing protein [Subsaxibacter sp. CAU 1640]MCK7591908.1 T9SS type A sorting domain-containing protein [Subsaxibacter sp. CAU 1640]
MKHLYFYCSLFLLPFLGFSQCPEGNLLLFSQSDIDNFSNTYPNCTAIQGFVIIQGSDIVDVSSLSMLNSVGSLLINQTSLTNIVGLEDLTITGLDNEDAFLVIDNNPMLQNLQFLDNYLANVPLVFVIRDMSSLTSLAGADSITEFVTLYLENNDALTSLNGLNENLNFVTGFQSPLLYITENDMLSDITMLETAQWNNALTAEITNNSQLFVCSNALVCSLASIDAITVSNNAPGCNSLAEVSASCGTCPEGPLVLNSQAQVDAFATMYPDCTALSNGLYITGADITDLSPLSSITSISSDILIESNPLLTNLTGLENVVELDTNFESLMLIDNPLLNDISALQNMVHSEFGYYIVIDNNDSLTNLVGLENIYTEEIYITDNEVLQTLNGLTGNMPIQIYIENNPILNDISAFEGLNFDPLYYPLLSIRNNPNLNVCNIAPFCTSIASYYSENVNNSNYRIENNAPGCTSIPEVALACGIIPSNDECNDAVALMFGTPINAYTNYSTASTQTPSCNDAIDRQDVWFAFYSGDVTSVDISVDGGYYLQLWQGDCTSLNQVTDACGAMSLQDIPITANTTYYVQVWSIGEPRLGNNTLFELLVEDATLSVPEANLENISIYPNPVKDKLVIEANSITERIELYNMLGQLVMISHPIAARTDLDTKQLQSGMYILKIINGNQAATFRVMKE